MKRAFGLMAVALLLMSAPAGAADLGKSNVDSVFTPAKSVNWTGFYVGGQVGYGNTAHNLEVTATDNKDTMSAFVDGLNGSGIFAGGTIGADLQRGKMVFGVFADYNFSAVEATAGASYNSVEMLKASAKDGDSWLVAARMGYLVNDHSLIYVLGGYGQQDMTYAVSMAGSADYSKDVTFSGWTLGAGGEVAITNNIFLGLEYQHFFGGKETLYSEATKNGSLAITDTIDSDRVMAKLKLKLNVGNSSNW
jgi:outer membrane immunogenic protein